MEDDGMRLLLEQKDAGRCNSEEQGQVLALDMWRNIICRVEKPH